MLAALLAAFLAPASVRSEVPGTAPCELSSEQGTEAYRFHLTEAELCEENPADPGAALDRRKAEIIAACQDDYRLSERVYRRHFQRIQFTRQNWDSLCSEGAMNPDQIIDHVELRSRTKLAQDVLQALGDSVEVSTPAYLAVDQPVMEEFMGLQNGQLHSTQLTDQVDGRQRQIRALRARLERQSQAALAVVEASSVSAADVSRATAAFGARSQAMQGAAQGDAGASGQAFDGSMGVGGAPTAPGAGSQPPPTDAELKARAREGPQSGRERQLSALLAGPQGEYAQRFQQTSYGQGLISSMSTAGVAYPPIVIRSHSNPKVGAVYDSDAHVIELNAHRVRQAYPWARNMTDAQIQQHLIDNPQDRSRLVEDSQDVMLHEHLHSHQNGVCPLRRHDVPRKNYLDGEVMALEIEAANFAERARRDPGLLTRAQANPFQQHLPHNAAVLSVDPDGFRRQMLKTYYGQYGTNAAELDPTIQLQQQRISQARNADERARREEGLRQLQRADAYYAQHQAADLPYRRPETRAEYLRTVAGSYFTSDPGKAVGYYNQAIVGANRSACGWLSANGNQRWGELCGEFTTVADRYRKGRQLPAKEAAAIQSIYQACEAESPPCAGGG